MLGSAVLAAGAGVLIGRAWEAGAGVHDTAVTARLGHAGAPARDATDGGRIPAPDPALFGPAPGWPGRTLPVLSADGRAAPSRLRYAARVPRVLDGQARIAIVVDGVGLDHQASLDLLRLLPPPVTVAISPYAENTAGVLEAARRNGHEMLASIPMEPAGSPQDDEGDMQLTAQAGVAANIRRLDWALSATPGIVGATGAESGQSGSTGASSRTLMDAIGRTLAARGLLYVDPVPNHAPVEGAWQVDADLVLDPDMDAPGVDRALDRVLDTAIRQGRALAIAGPPSRLLIDRLLAWSRRLPGSGVVLVPASSLAAPPPVGPSGGDPNRDARALAARLEDTPH